MSRGTVRRLAGALTGSAVAVALAGAPAAAAPPLEGSPHLEFNRFHDDEVVHTSTLSAQEWPCAFDVTITNDITVVERFSRRGPDGLAYFHANVHGSVTFSANGHEFEQRFSVVDRDFKIVDEGDTLLITVQSAGGSRWYADGTLVFRDPGMIRVQFRVDHAGTPADPSDDTEVPGEPLVVKGSTGLNETEGRDFCADLAEFLDLD